MLYASDTGCKLIITDRKGIREAQRRGVSCISTQDILVSAIHQGIVSLEEADALITTWKSMNEYPVSVTTFTNLFGSK
jgi:predicted nucleic acid-binding protein